MNGLHLEATFPDGRSADDAARTLAGFAQNVRVVVDDQSAREERMIWRIVLVIVLWSCVGAAIGAALGAVIALTIGPSGTEGLVLQIAVWGIFAHILVGMWAGYLLLADRTARELPVKVEPVVLTISCDSIEQRSAITESLRSSGALDITIEANLNLTGGSPDAEHVPNR